MIKKVLHTHPKAFIVCFALILSSCSDDVETPKVVTITEFSPSIGIVGETVIVTGTNFSTTASDNVVKFNGATATVTEATATQLTLTVPADATSGKITVTTNGNTIESTSDFTVPAPTLAGFNPAIAGTGVPVTITGTNFSSSAENNIIKINGVAASITSASPTQLIATVPAGASTGSITVDVGANKATSANTIEICNNAELMMGGVSILNQPNATSYALSMKIINLGSVPVDVTKILIQNYASTDEVLGNDVASGGYFLTQGPTALLPGQSYSMVNYMFNVGSGKNTTTHPYAVITMSVPGGSITECHTEDNIVFKHFN
ncbi:MAG TPA: IPT/TIG domain-containing protein [Cyclobacteriaceae bacterium]|nr:IPT/TIG domain-containing protein [Cyclobacteriaceae bacterium]